VIVIDQSAKKYELQRFPGLEHIYHPGLSGLAAARNLGCSLAVGDIVAFFDDDVELRPCCLDALSKASIDNPDAVGFQLEIEGLHQHFDLTTLHEMIFQHGFFSAGYFVDKPSQLSRLRGCAMAFRSATFLHERFDEKLVGYGYGEDWEFSRRAQRWGRLVLAQGARVIHHTSPTNRFKKREILEMRWEAFNYFYNKLRGDTRWIDRFWHLWWEFGESINWLRFGMGFPVLGIKGPRVPDAGESAK